MDFWENIPSRKEQEAVLGRTRRAVSSRPELEDALPEWAVELLSPTAFWPESYMPVPPDFGDRPKPPLSRSQPLPPAPRYQPLPPRYQPLPPVPRYQPLSPAPSYQPLSPAPSYQPRPPVPSYQLLPPVPSYQPPPLRTIRVGVVSLGYHPVPPGTPAPALTPVPEPCPVPEPTPRLPEGDRPLRLLEVVRPALLPVEETSTSPIHLKVSSAL
ncbi:unnamed protein product [Boreogadus saida]